ncbi:MAG TPA: penicillin-binding transpeptidase domain-containing protein [Methylomusa anaerophila]|uniref:Penicillin-binding protein 4*A n=1 Tax=Methylomusa anaerophila TaxID=1930071 RepID=A0A348APN9_9FIRM|nr:penicillin-binding transpeptidase domain-containing protein [Methylomusa anaerophila]BBB93037.1 penicillin-binding protein 4*A [Methylomusa anaerophila]HML87129.1 penicillin-binding transpeptidase domain-containing protein [Methylomusa anaerophila]
MLSNHSPDSHDNIYDNIRRNVRFTGLCLIVLLTLLFIYVSYLQVVQSEYLAFHPLNRRFAEASRKIERGKILDAKHNVLAYSKIINNNNDNNEYGRQYPYGAMYAPVIGYDSIKYGKSGIESAGDIYLSGRNTPEYRLGPINRLFGSKPGNTVLLTVDSNLQETAYRALGSSQGAVVVLEPHTGAILALVSKPSFDPDSIDSNWANISQAQNSPLLNRATQGLYPPGSIIKVLIAELALSANIADKDTRFNCSGSLKIGPDYVLNETNSQAHGRVSLEQALAVSCNVTFGSLALELGRNKIAQGFESFGFSRLLDGEFIESPVHLPEFDRLSDGDLAQIGIGQGSLLVTPLRMAMLAATIANNGTTMKPFLIQKVITLDGTVIKGHVPEKWLSPVSPKLSDSLSKMMVKVVQEGTGTSANISGITIAGKTGTAENPHGAAHAWFIGFAPADNPRVAMAVIVENGGSGGSVAAPIARQIFEQALR